jgi:hypothetical protein
MSYVVRRFFPVQSGNPLCSTRHGESYSDFLPSTAVFCLSLTKSFISFVWMAFFTFHRRRSSIKRGLLGPTIFSPDFASFCSGVQLACHCVSPSGTPFVIWVWEFKTNRIASSSFGCCVWVTRSHLQESFKNWLCWNKAFQQHIASFQWLLAECSVRETTLDEWLFLTYHHSIAKTHLSPHYSLLHWRSISLL